MKILGPIHACLCQHAKDFSLSSLAHGDVPRQIRLAIRATADERQWRTSPLARETVFWLLLGMAIYRNQSIPSVFSRLVADMRGDRLGLSLHVASHDALAHARARLGSAPLRTFFERQAARIDPPASFHGRRVWAIDGARINLADTPENEAGFGRPPCGQRSSFPQLQVLTLTSAITHEVKAISWCPVPPDERGAAARLIPHLGKDDLVLLDRGLFAAWLAADVLRQGADLLARIPGSVRPIVRAMRSEGDYDVVLHRPGIKGRTPRARRTVTLQARMIEFRIGTQHYRLLTSLTDAAITKQELAALYHQRWEAEIAFDEIKSHLTAPPHAQAPTHLRGRSPQRIEQELWATFAAYNLVRGLMARAANRAAIPARHISFVRALEVIRFSAAPMAHARLDQLPRLFERLLDDLTHCAMRRPRRLRSAPRVVKARTKHYPAKRPEHRCRTRPSRPTPLWGATR